MAPAELQSHFPFFEGQSYLIIIMEAVNFIVDLAYLKLRLALVKKLVFILFIFITIYMSHCIFDIIYRFYCTISTTL